VLWSRFKKHKTRGSENITLTHIHMEDQWRDAENKGGKKTNSIKEKM
jgi:uncharacterized protein (DUF952 family)